MSQASRRLSAVKIFYVNIIRGDLRCYVATKSQVGRGHMRTRLKSNKSHTACPFINHSSFKLCACWCFSSYEFQQSIQSALGNLHLTKRLIVFSASMTSPFPSRAPFFARQVYSPVFTKRTLANEICATFFSPRLNVCEGANSLKISFKLKIAQRRSQASLHRLHLVSSQWFVPVTHDVTTTVPVSLPRWSLMLIFFRDYLLSSVVTPTIVPFHSWIWSSCSNAFQVHFITICYYVF